MKVPIFGVLFLISGLCGLGATFMSNVARARHMYVTFEPGSIVPELKPNLECIGDKDNCRGFRFRCHSGNLETCLDTDLWEPTGRLDENGDLSFWEIEISPVPGSNLKGKVPERVIARVHGLDICGASGNCPEMLFERSSGNDWIELLEYSGTGMDVFEPTQGRDRPSVVSSGHLSAYETYWSLFVPDDDEYQIALSEIRSRQASNDSGSTERCVLTTDGLDLLTAMCPALESDTWSETPEFETNDVDSSEYFAQTIIPDDCYLEPPEADDNFGFMVFKPGEACEPLFGAVGMAWRAAHGLWHVADLRYFESTDEQAAHETLKVVDMLATCPIGCGGDAIIMAGSIAGESKTDTFWQTTIDLCYQVVQYVEPGVINIEWYSTATKGRTPCDSSFIIVPEFSGQIYP